MKKHFSLKKLFKSMRSRIFIFGLLIGIIPSILFSLGFSFVYENEVEKAEVLSVTSESQILGNDILTSGYLKSPTDEAVNITLDSVAQSLSGRILVLDRTLRVIKDTYSLYEGRTVIWDIAIKALSGATAYDRDKVNKFLTVCVPITGETEGDAAPQTAASSPVKRTGTVPVSGVIMFVCSMENTALSKNTQGSFLILFLVANIVAAFGISLLISKRLTAPLRRLSSEIEDVEKGFSEPVLKENSVSEAAEISSHFNSYAAVMKTMNDSRQEFVSNVSHELKTPLASMKVLADSLNSMEDVPADMYREFMADITGEIDRETTIINDLLTLVRFDRGSDELSVSSVRINDLLELLMKRLSPIAEKANVELVLETFRPIVAEIDETKFSLAISNLIENAIKYNKKGGYVHVSLNSDHRYFYIHVEDNGIGIPEESIPHIFERFYRADKSHSREIGGTGLGLAITQTVIRMHRGEIKVKSVLDEGTRFAVRVPLKYITEEKDVAAEENENEDF